MTDRIVFLDKGTIGPGVTLRRPGFAHDWQEFERTAGAEVVGRLAGARIAITNKVPIRGSDLEQLPDLDLIAVAATGYDVIDTAACAARGVVVSNIRGYAGHTVPEHTFALILALRRNLAQYRAEVLEGRWVKEDQFCFFNRPIGDLAGTTLGVVGAGVIGRAVGAIGAAFGMRVLYHDDYAPQAPENGALVSRAELVAEADVITVHCPLTDETRGMIGTAEFDAMKPHALVINTARGGIIDEEALVAAIESDRIGGAGIDVASVEPTPLDHPLMRIARRWNVLFTPHVAWAGVQAMQSLCDQLIDNIEAFHRGEPRNTVVPAAQ